MVDRFVVAQTLLARLILELLLLLLLLLLFLYFVLVPVWHVLTDGDQRVVYVLEVVVVVRDCYEVGVVEAG